MKEGASTAAATGGDSSPGNRRSFTLSSAADVLTTAASFGTGVLVARVLGVEERGLYSFVTVTGAVIAYLTGMGLFEALLAKGTRPAPGAGRLAGLLGLGGTAVMVGLGLTQDEKLLILYAPLPIIWGLLQVRLAQARIAGRRAWFWLRIIAPTLQLVTTLTFIALDILTVGSAIVSLLVGFAVAVGLDAVVVAFRRSIPEQFDQDPLGKRDLLRRGAHQHLVNVPRTLNYRGPVIMLGFLATQRDVGLYAVAGSVASLVPILTWSIPQNLLAMRSNKDEAASRVTRQLVMLSWLAGVIGGILALLIGGEILGFVYGSEFSTAALAFAILTFAQAPWLHSSLVQAEYRAGGRAHVAAMIETFTLVLSVALILALYPVYGITGAAAGVAVSYTVNAVLTHSQRRPRSSAAIADSGNDAEEEPNK